MATTYLSFGPSTPGDPPVQYGLRVNLSLAELQSEMSQALAGGSGLFTAKEMIRNGERDVLINAHQVRFAVQHG